MFLALEYNFLYYSTLMRCSTFFVPFQGFLCCLEVFIIGPCLYSGGFCM